MLRWEQLDLERGFMRLEPGTRKNGQGRLIPLVTDVHEVLWQWKWHLLAHHPARRWRCHYREKRLRAVPTKNLRNACERVGLNGKLFHDLRKTAIRNMVRRGISERVTMEISWHRTRSLFDRYDIVSEADIHEARTRLNQGHRVRTGLSFDETREWNAGSLSASSPAPSEHNGEHSEGEVMNLERLTS